MVNASATKAVPFRVEVPRHGGPKHDLLNEQTIDRREAADSLRGISELGKSAASLKTQSKDKW